MNKKCQIPEFDLSMLSRGIQRVAIVGSSESGKTTLCYRMLEEAFLDRTNIFLVYAQNNSTLREWGAFFKYHGLQEQVILINESKDDEKLKTVLKEVEDTQGNLEKPLSYCLILDDFIGSIRGTSLQKKKTLIHSFSYQSRHNNMSVFFLLQDIIALDAREFSSNTCNVIMKDESICNMENHYDSKILGHTADSIIERCGSKGARVSTFCSLMRGLQAYESLCAYKSRKTQKTKLYIIPNVEKRN